MTETTAPTGTSKTAHPADLNLFHRNPRVGNVDVIKASLRAHSQYKPILVNKGTHTGRPSEVLAGNHTLKAIRDLAEEHPDDERWQSVLTWEIDVDDDRANRIVVADNRTSELGGTDEEALLELLEEIDDDLLGTGYDDDDLSLLMKKLRTDEDDIGSEMFKAHDYDDDEDDEDEIESDDEDSETGVLTCPECNHQWEPRAEDEEVILPTSPEEANDN